MSIVNTDLKKKMKNKQRARNSILHNYDLGNPRNFNGKHVEFPYL